MPSQEFVQKMKERLIEEKERLNEELAGLQEHTEMGDEEDENASEVEIDVVNHDIADTIKADLDKIDAALKRIEDGTYGVDAEGKEISESRLEVLPWADTNVEA